MKAISERLDTIRRLTAVINNPTDDFFGKLALINNLIRLRNEVEEAIDQIERQLEREA